MYDVRAYEKGPFARFTPDAGGPIDFSSVKFSHDGKLMLLGTTQGRAPRAVEDGRAGGLPRRPPRPPARSASASASSGPPPASPSSLGRRCAWAGLVRHTPALCGTQVLLLDAFSGALERVFSGHDNSRQLPLEPCFVPDAEYVLSGSEDGTVWRWRTATGEALPPLQGHTGPVGALKVNPTRMLLASACLLSSSPSPCASVSLAPPPRP